MIFGLSFFTGRLKINTAQAHLILQTSSCTGLKQVAFFHNQYKVAVISPFSIAKAADVIEEQNSTDGHTISFII
jgi:hypothetical protein